MQLLIGVLQAIVLLTYPVAVYFGRSHLSSRGIGLLVLALLLPSLVKAVLHRRKQLAQTASLPIAVACLMLLAVAFDDERFVLTYPALVNLVLLAQFAWTLPSGRTSMVERFARLQVDDLSPAEIAYCRKVTAAWSLFFVVNGGVCAGLAFWAPRGWWALYTGLFSYALLGVGFAIEYTLRKYLFRRYDAGLLDRFYSRLFPAPRVGEGTSTPQL